MMMDENDNNEEILDDPQLYETGSGEDHSSKEGENSLEVIIAKRLGHVQGWNALKQTLKDRKVDILEMVSSE